MGAARSPVGPTLADAPARPDVTGARFRQVLGRVPTSVAVVTATGGDAPLGMTVGSFTSVSLDPPLVAFFVDRRSTTWPQIGALPAFCVNILGHDQGELCHLFARRGVDRFTGVAWHRSADGSPVLDGAIVAIECEPYRVETIGDHLQVVGLVRRLDVLSDDPPLVFLEGALVSAGRPAEAPTGPVETSTGPAGDPLTDAVVASFAAAPDPRLAESLAVLVRHLHAAIREIRPTPEEWGAAVEFLTATGQRCDATRQEFILLSDVLGVSMLTVDLNHTKSPEATEDTVLGPFHMVASPPRGPGDTIDLVGRGEPCLITGRVLSADGTPLPGASVDVWQADDAGFYDVQQPDVQPPGNGRGLFTTDGDGAFWLRTVMPTAYPIPVDGPVGTLLERTGRHPHRPAHVHLIAAASGHVPVTTHVFVADGPFLDSDPVFAVKESLIRPFAVVDDAAGAARFGIANPYRHAHVDLVLDPLGGVSE